MWSVLYGFSSEWSPHFMRFPLAMVVYIEHPSIGLVWKASNANARFELSVSSFKMQFNIKLVANTNVIHGFFAFIDTCSCVFVFTKLWTKLYFIWCISHQIRHFIPTIYNPYHISPFLWDEFPAYTAPPGNFLFFVWNETHELGHFYSTWAALMR